MTLLLGIDIGTTNCKAGIFTTTGTQISNAKEKTVCHGDKSGEYAYYPDEIWTTVTNVIRKALSGIEYPDAVRALSIASMAESGLLIDEEGNPTSPIIPYFDRRALPQCKILEEKLGEPRIFSITGLDIHPLYSLGKILWIRDNHPDVFARSVKWLCLPDYIYYRLTKEFATDFTIASRTMAFDLNNSCWSQEILDAVDLNPEMFPPTFASGTLIGRVTRDAAGQTDLCQGTPVITGGHDHYCGSLAAGILQGRRAVNSIGTTESIHTLLPKPFKPSEKLKCFHFGHYVHPDYIYIDAGLSASGLVVDWSLKRFASLEDWNHTENESKASLPYEAVFRGLEKTSPSSQGLLFLPHLRGGGYPDWDPHSRGTLIGLRTSHTSPDILRAVIEGLCFETRRALEEMVNVVESPSIEQINVIGGGSRIDFWMQTKADITGLPIEIPDVEDATVLGAALLAGVGIGIYKDMNDASNRTYRTYQRYEPRSQFHEKYEWLFNIFQKLACHNVAEINRELDAMALAHLNNLS